MFMFMMVRGQQELGINSKKSKPVIVDKVPLQLLSIKVKGRKVHDLIVESGRGTKAFCHLNKHILTQLFHGFFCTLPRPWCLQGRQRQEVGIMIPGFFELLVPLNPTACRVISTQ